jgi:hypothetical protein
MPDVGRLAAASLLRLLHRVFIWMALRLHG